MTGDEYLQSMYVKYSAPTGELGPGNQVMFQLSPYINYWAGQNLLSRQLSGSYAKGTAVVGDADVDIFISMRSNSHPTLGDMYDSLDKFLKAQGFVTKRQNVSIGITYNRFYVDLIPAWKQNSQTFDHSLYLRRTGSNTKTNVVTHILNVRNSGLAPVITLIKRWRDFQNLDFPSFYLELATLAALNQTRVYGLENRVLTVLRYFENYLCNAKISDPSNASNTVSDLLNSKEKFAIADAANTSLSKKNWGEIIA